MGAILCSQDETERTDRNKNGVVLELINETGTENNWKKKIEKLSKDIKLQSSPKSGHYRWIMLCKSKLKGSKIDVTETIRDHLPQRTEPGMVIMIIEGHHDFEPYYPDSRIKYITFVDMEFKQTYRVRQSLKSFILKDFQQTSHRNKYEVAIPCVEVLNSNTIEVYGNQNVGRQVHIIVKNEGIDGIVAISTQARKDIHTFLQETQSGTIDIITQIQGESSAVSEYIRSLLTEEREDVNVNVLQDEKVPTHPWIFVCDAFVENEFLILKKHSQDKFIQCVVHHVEKLESYDIKVCGNQDKDKQVDTMENDGMENTFAISAQVREDIQTFLLENPSDEIDVITQIQGESNTICEHLKDIVTPKPEAVNVNFFQANSVPTHPWLFLCDTFNENEFLKLKEASKVKCIRCVVNHAEKMKSHDIKVCGNQDKDRQVHTMENEEIKDSFVISTKVREDIQTFLLENHSDEIDVITQIQGESSTVCEHLKSIVAANFEAVKVNFLQSKSFPTHPWISFSDAIDENEFLKLKGASKVKSIWCVINHVQKMESYDIKVYRTQDNNRQVNVMEKEEIEGTFVLSTQVREDMQTFLLQNSSDEIDVITQIQGESPTLIEHLKGIVTAKIKDLKVNFLQTNSVPTHPWIFLCDAFDESEFPKLQEASEDNGCMVLRLHVCQKIHLKATIPDVAKDDNKPTIYLVLGNPEIGDNLYTKDFEREEPQSMLGSLTTRNDAGDIANKRNLESKGVSSQLRKQVYIKCIGDLPKRAISNFIERYITGIEPIWMTGEDPVEEGSLCIAVCFNLSRLQDEIAAVLQVTPQDCKNMLVVIQNCQEGMPPKPMLRSNPSDKVVDFTNILYYDGDGECYDCDVNSEARKKMQAFIDNK